jgi:hypothetical protein
VSVAGSAVTFVKPGARCLAHATDEPEFDVLDVDPLALGLPVLALPEVVVLDGALADDGDDEQPPAMAATASGAIANESGRTGDEIFFFIVFSPRGRTAGDASSDRRSSVTDIRRH